MPLISQDSLAITKRNLATVRAIVTLYGGAFTEAQVRSWIAARNQNGFAACVVKPTQRRLYVDVDRFDEWLDQRTRDLSI
jgi:hypothetical protein